MAEPLNRKNICHIGDCEITIARKLGEGASKAVYAADFHFAGEEKPARYAVAISTAKEPDPSFCREVEVLANSRLKGAGTMAGPYPLVDCNGVTHQAAVGEHIPGVNLEKYIKGNGPQDPGETASAMSQIARTLHSAHRDGFVHLDVKSGNVMRSPDGTCSLIDWELVTRQGERTDMISGTPTYISPEMARLEDKAIDTKMDVYSAGLILEEMSNGFVRSRCSPALDFDNEDQALRGFEEISKNKTRATTRDPLLSLAMQRATEHDPAKRGTALDMMTDLAAFPEARKHYDAEDRAEIVANLMERTKDLNRRQPTLDAAAARGMLQDLPVDHPKRIHLEAVAKLAPTPDAEAVTLDSAQRPRSTLTTQKMDLNLPVQTMRR